MWVDDMIFFHFAVKSFPGYIKSVSYTILQILEVNPFERKPIFSPIADGLNQIPDKQDDHQ